MPEDGVYRVLRDGEEVGTIDDRFLAMRIDGLTIHQTAVEPHGRYEYEVEKRTADTETEPGDEPLTDGGGQDVLIHAAPIDLGHKWLGNLGGDDLAYWRVSGTPQRTEPGCRVWFESGGRIIAWGEIEAVEDGKLWFDGAHKTDLPCPDDAPTRGFTYIDPLLPRLDEVPGSARAHETGRGELRTDGGNDAVRMERPMGEDGLALRPHEREHVPLTELRAAKYPMLEDGITMGTICRYLVDEWSWVVVTDLPDETWGEVFDEDDERAEEKVVRFLNLEKLSDAEFELFDNCVGCYEHLDTARLFQDHEGAGNYIRRSDFLEKFEGLGPLHPDKEVDQDVE